MQFKILIYFSKEDHVRVHFISWNKYIYKNKGDVQVHLPLFIMLKLR